MGKRRVVITGIGVIAPNGIGTDAFWEAVRQGRSGVKKITRFDASTYPSQVAGEVRDFDPADFLSPRETSRMDRFCRFAVAAARMAIEDARISVDRSNASRIGTIIGSAIGGFPFAEKQYDIFLEKGLRRVDPTLAIRLFPGASSAQIAIALGLHGPNLTVSTACSSGAFAIGNALNLVRSGAADMVVTGGAEAPLSPLSYGAFCNIRALSRDSDPEGASKPFDARRDGFVMSEGAGILVLEELEHARKRGATIYSELTGFGMTNDAFDMIRPHPDGEQVVHAIHAALGDADCSADDVDYISAHGSSTPINDSLETKIVKKVFKSRAMSIPISSLKSMTGHLLGASAALELIVSALIIKRGFIHPTINYKCPDPECDLDYVPNKGISKDVSVILSNSLGFGGCNASLVLEKYGRRNNGA